MSLISAKMSSLQDKLREQEERESKEEVEEVLERSGDSVKKLKVKK